MVAISAIIILLVAHYISDFLLQTRWMANNKSKNLKALSLHVLVYTVGIAIASTFILDGQDIIFYALLNGGLHFVTDFFTSKWTSSLYKKENWFGFFGVVGLDQLIHGLTLLTTLTLF